jgi:hypothetical protein
MSFRHHFHDSTKLELDFDILKGLTDQEYQIQGYCSSAFYEYFDLGFPEVPLIQLLF